MTIVQNPFCWFEIAKVKIVSHQTVELSPKLLAAFACREFFQVVSYVP